MQKSRENETRQKRYIKVLISFFIMMVILTVFSRVADSITIAKVYVKTPTRGSLLYETKIEGKIEVSEKSKMRIDEGFKIEKIYIEKGQKVSKGDKLFLLDKKEIEDYMFKLKTEIQLLELKKQSLELQSYANSYEEEVAKAELELERAKNDRDINIEINGIELEKDKRIVEDAQAALEVALKQKEKQEISNKELQEKNEIEKKSIDLDLSLKLNEYSRAENLNKIGNVIYAEQTGIVDDIFLKEGEKTTGSDVISIIDENSKYIFESKIDKEKVKYIKVGDPVKLTLSGKQIPIDNVVIKSINIEADNVKLIADIPDNIDITYGIEGSIKHSFSTDEYNKLIPLSALRSDSGQDYILAVSEKNTVMGKEKVAYRINVTVAEKNDTYAAISSGVDNEEIITKSNKSITEGDRVRIEKP